MTDTSGESVPATFRERQAARAVLVALDDFADIVREDHDVSSNDPLPIDHGDLNNWSQVRSFFRMVADTGALR